MKPFVVLLLIFAINANGQSTHTKNAKGKSAKQVIKTPDELWGQLFIDVQLSRALADNKTFVDAVPKFKRNIILKKYNDSVSTNGKVYDLKKFVYQNFKIPVTASINLPKKLSSLEEHLNQLWPYLIRKADIRQDNSTLLPLPFSYVVPGGRFREIYYWDSYFTMQGLAAYNRYDLVENMLDNFKYLIEEYGHIPNGNRSYYLSRSQPPYYALMVDLLKQKQGDIVYNKFLPSIQKEYDWWMNGADDLGKGGAYRRVVRLDDGSLLNRYYDDKNAPREESYYEDVHTASIYMRKDSLAYRHLRAGAESGWDFSSRWLADTVHLATIETTDILPLDLNCLLYKYELILSSAYQYSRELEKAKFFTEKAANRKEAILKHFWSEKDKYFFDYHLVNRNNTGRPSLAAALPLFVGIATDEQAMGVKNSIEQTFLKPGGVVTTPYHTGQQWDAPNGWAPLQFLVVKGLMNYGYDSLAKEISTRWMKVNENVFASTGKMLEKYNVEDINLPGGGGEYPTQDGFGWSNGVYLAFKKMFK